MNVKWLLLAVIFIIFSYVVVECSALPLPAGFKYSHSSSAYLTQDEYWFSQTLDHYSPTDHRQFNQRYYEFLDYFQAPDGPIFLKVCGESSCNGISNDYLAVLAKKFGAAIVSLEHRYYGKSSPFKESTTHNLQYLSSKQALFDLAAFRNYYQELTNKKQNLSNYDNSWFVFGVSYPGALSAWFRLKFPHLTCGSLASSAVVLAIYNFTDFDRQIGESAGPACKKALQEVTRLAEQGLSTNAKAVKSLFGAEKLNDGDFLYLLADAAVTAFQYGNPDVLCSPLVEANSSGKDLMVAYADYVKNSFFTTLGGSVKIYGQQFLKNTTIDADNNEVSSSRLWWYQVCTEVAYFQVAPSNDSIRSSKVDTKYHLDLCENVFGKGIYPEVDITNLYYGGNSIAGSKIIFMNGSQDPWRHASKQKSSDNNVSAEQSSAVRRRHSSGSRSAVDPRRAVRQRTDEGRPTTPHTSATEPSGSHSGSRGGSRGGSHSGSRDTEDVDDDSAVGGEVPPTPGLDDAADGRDPPDPWEDDISRMTLRDIEGQRDRLRENLLSIPEHSPSSASMGMMLEAVESLLQIYRSMGPLGSLWTVSCQRRRAAVMGPDKWPAVRDATKDCDVKRTLFDIPPDRAAGQPLRLKEFKLEAAAPYVYDRFIGAWGVFPHHHQVPVYFARHLYAEFVLGMHPDYTSTGSSFYGAGGGRSATRPGARRDPAAQPEPVLLVGRPRPTVLRSDDVVEPSQLATEERSALAHATRMAMHGTMLAVQAERDRAAVEPELPWLDDAAVLALDYPSVQTYALTMRDAYHRVIGTRRPRPTGQERTFTELLFASDASDRDRAAAPHAHVDESVPDKGKGIDPDYTQTRPGPSQDPPVDETQAQVAADEGVGAAMMFTDQWVDAAQPGVFDGQSAQEGLDLPAFTIDSAELPDWSAYLQGPQLGGQDEGAPGSSVHDGRSLDQWPRDDL